jgi:SAM-dependent methyltransferase
LAILAAAPDLQHALGLLPKRVNALIEGYAGSRNAEALQAFLALAGVRDMDIVAIDLFDLPATYRRLSMTLPNMRFIQADACSLGAVAADGEFDVVVQDFLLNCLPPADAPRLLAEVARVLAPEGRFILSVTDSSGLQTRPALTPERLACDWGVRWDRSASYLSCIVPDPLLRQDALRALAGCIVADQAREQHTLIAAPHGRFEFFVPWAQTERQLNDAGFRVLLAQTQWGRDDHGLDCHRHRIIAAHR